VRDVGYPISFNVIDLEPCDGIDWFIRKTHELFLASIHFDESLVIQKTTECAISYGAERTIDTS